MPPASAWLITGCSVLCLGVCLPMYRRNFKEHTVFATIFKSLGTLCAMTLALVAAIKLEPRAYVCAGAILICSVSDFILNFNFTLGMLTFIIGHFGLAAWFLIMNLTAAPVISAMHIICFIGFCLISFFIIYKWRKMTDKKNLPSYAIYAAMLSAMTACAVAGGSGLHSTAGIICAIGGGMFYISNVMAFRTTFGQRCEAYETALMVIYYCAQLLFGASCLLTCLTPVI